MITALRDRAMRDYVTLVLLAWVFVPEIRRFSDWQSGFHLLSVIAIVPLASLVPGIFIWRKYLPQMGPLFRVTLICWLLAFVYGFLVALISNQLVAGLYDAMSTLLPAAMVFFAVWKQETFRAAHERFAGAALWAAVIASVYGIYQYVSPPPWDVYWVQNSMMMSVGSPEPFGLRIFGPMNSPGPYAQFLVLAIVINLPRLGVKTWWRILALVPVLVALMLSLVRVCWVQLAIGVLAYIVLSPRRRGILISLGVFIICTALAGATLAGLGKGGSIGLTAVTDRLSTFGSLDDDASVTQRQAETASAWQNLLDQPLGLGLGTYGTAAKLGSVGATNTLDNGYFARFVELGFIGAVPMFLGLLLPFVRAVPLPRIKELSIDDRSILAAAVAIQVMLLVGELGGDLYSAVAGIFFWLEVGLVSQFEERTAPILFSSSVKSSKSTFGAPAENMV